MYGSKGAWMVIGALVIVVGGALGVRWQASLELRRELEQLRSDHRELQGLEEENRRLTASQVTAAELESLRADHAALEHLRRDLEALKDGPPVHVAAPSAKIIPASEWKNVGRATPEAAVETALWAAAGGDLDVLVGTLGFDVVARAKMESLFNGLPDAARSQYSSPEHLVALLLAKDVPPESTMQVTGEDVSTDHPTYTSLHLQLQPVTGPTKSVTLIMQQQDGGWKVMVPANVVDKFGNALKGLPTTDGPVSVAVPGG